MIATFDHFGLRFQYPENWSITDESSDDWPKSVSVQSPGSGFWSVMQYDLGTDHVALLDETLQEMRTQYEDLETSVISEVFDEQDVLGYEMFFYCLDFLVCARALTVRADDGKVYLILWQAEDREYAQVEAVFRAITTSLLREIRD